VSNGVLVVVDADDADVMQISLLSVFLVMEMG
jgi:hypothetical protein